MSLDKLAKGKISKIKAFNLNFLNYNNDFKKSLDRLHEMGFIPGTKIEILHKAPFGGPLVVKVMGYNICLRRDCAKLIEVAN